MGKADERWDIYDRDKKLTGRTMLRNDWNMQPGDFHLTVLAVIRHTDGRYLITKRAMTKSWAPGHWEVSGGGVQAGETSLEGVLREVKEETGLDVSGFEGGYLFSYSRENPDEGDNYFVDIYRFTGDFSEADLKMQADETEGFRLVTLDDIKEVAARNEFLHYKSIERAFE